MSSDKNNNITENPYLHLYQKIELLEELLKHSRENSKKWHRAYQKAEKLEIENKWLRAKLRSIRDEHEETRRSHRAEFINKYKFLRKVIEESRKQISLSLRDKEVAGFHYKFPTETYIFERPIIIHPNDHSPAERDQLIKTIHPASLETLIKRLVRERDLAYKTLYDFMKTL